MTAEEFLDRLQQQGLIDAKSIASLRRQVQGSEKTVSAQAVAKLLIDKGRLTAFQAKQMLDREGDAVPAPPPRRGRQVGESDMRLAAPKTEGPAAAESPLTLLPDQTTPRASVPPGGRPQEKAAPLAELADADGLTLLPDSGLAKPPPADALPTDPLLDDMSMGMGQGMAMGGFGQPGTGQRKKVKAGQWDSPLMLLGGGGLLLLLLLLVFLVFILTRGNADDLFKEAQQAYQDRSYSSAIEKYDEFVSKYSKNEKVSLARVRRGLAHLRLAVENKAWQRSLDTANSILPTIESENSFVEARPELASLLPDIAEAFAQRTKDDVNAEDMIAAEQNYDLAMQAMELVNNGSYISTDLRDSQSTRIARIEETLEDAKRRINQDKELSRSIAEIEQWVEQGKTVEAYAARRRLLKSYPELETHSDLKAAVLLITAKQRDLVNSNPEPLTIEKDDLPATTEARVLLARSRVHAAAADADSVVLVLAGGTVYGIHRGNGGVLWRRRVGYDTKYHPLLIDQTLGGGAILVDGRRNELLRVRSDNGQLLWRVAIPGSFSRPVVNGKSVYVATSNWVIRRQQADQAQWWTGADWSDDETQAKRYDTAPDIAGIVDNTSALVVDSGELFEIDLATGDTANRVVFPQALPTPPAFHSDGSKVYLLGDHSNLYVLSAADLKCQEVFYLGHKAGDIEVAPMFSLGHLLIASHSEPENAALHIVAVDDNGLSLTRPQQRPLGLSGRVVVPFAPDKGRVFVATDRGDILWLAVNPNRADEPVSIVQRVITAPKEPFTPYFLAADGQLWTADYRLTKFKVQTTLRKISKDGDSMFVGTACVAPLQKVDGAIIFVRRIDGSPGANVSAVSTNDAKLLWEINLGAPLAGPVIVDARGRRVFAVSAEADLYEIDQSALESGMGGSPIAQAGAKTQQVATLSQTVLNQSRLVFSSRRERQQVVLYDRENTSRLLRNVKLSVPSGPSRFTPVAFADGLLVASDAGQVFLLNATTGQQSALPFQPALEPNVSPAWRRPTVVGDDRDQFVVADSLGRMFRVGIESSPRPHLSALQQAEFDLEFVSPLAALGDTVYAVVRGGSNSFAIASFSLPDLQKQDETPLAGSVVWGPRQVGGAVLLATDAGELLCFGDAHQQRWTVTLPYGRLVGTPLVDVSDYLFASQRGVVWRLAADTGEETGKIDLGEPLTSGPVAFDQRLWINAADGSLLVVPMIAQQ